MARAAVVVSLVTTLGASALAVSLSRRGSFEAVTQLIALTSSALAWGGGFLFAVAAAMRALTRDEEEGLLALVRLRGLSTSAYLATRVGGLTAWLALLVAGGATGPSLAAIVALPSRAGVQAIARAAAAAVAYGALFALVLSVVVFAALGARTRAGGYGVLLVVLVLPDLVAPLLSALAPQSLEGALSVATALASAREAVGASPPHFASLAPSLAVLAAVTTVAALALLASARSTLTRAPWARRA